MNFLAYLFPGRTHNLTSFGHPLKPQTANTEFGLPDEVAFLSKHLLSYYSQNHQTISRAKQVRELGLENKPDRKIWEYAGENGSHG